MRKHEGLRSRGGGATDRACRSEWFLGFLYVLPLVAGCQTLTTRGKSEKEPDLQASKQSDALVIKTDFKTKVDATQKHNVHLEMGRAYETLGRLDDARRCFEELHGLDADYRDVAAKLGG